MKMRYFETRKARIEIIPMIDVMLFLLVFFIIVTLQMIPDAGVNLQLPVSSQTDPLPHPKFTVNVLPDGTIKVKDCGPGVAEADRELVFRRFWRGRRDNSHGAGLGLAIVSRIAEIHGAQIAIAENTAGGAVFTLTFKLGD